MQHETAINKIVLEAVKDPDATIRALLNLDNTVNSGLSTIFFFKPFVWEGQIFRSIHTVYFPTPWIIDKLTVELNRHQAVKKVEFFNTLCVHPSTRSAAGWVFEDFIHRYLVHAKSITIHWYSEASSRTLDLFPEALDTRTTNADLKSSAPFYWRPASLTNPGIDGAIITKEHVYLIQATISREHSSPQEGIDQLWHYMPQDKKVLEWKLLFIGPVADQMEEVSSKYANCLEVGDRDTRAAVQRDGILRKHLPVGRFCLFPDVRDFMRSVS